MRPGERKKYRATKDKVHTRTEGGSEEEESRVSTKLVEACMNFMPCTEDESNVEHRGIVSSEATAIDKAGWSDCAHFNRYLSFCRQFAPSRESEKQAVKYKKQSEGNQ